VNAVTTLCSEDETQKMETGCSYELLVIIQQTTWYYILEDLGLNTHQHENMVPTRSFCTLIHCITTYFKHYKRKNITVVNMLLLCLVIKLHVLINRDYHQEDIL